MLGASNIEQTKSLNYSSLNKILGNTVKKISDQRTVLKALATTENRERIFRFNGELVNAKQKKDYYYDPHTKHYTGQLKLLNTWCSGIRLADKGINMDFIHTSDGYPVYFDSTDNFYDLRERFLGNIKQFRLLMGFPDNYVITMIFDRGIYSINVFWHFILSETEHIITWEKGYANDKWDNDAKTSTGYLTKKRNSSKDLILIKYDYQDGNWGKDSRMRQLIVRVFDKEGKLQIELSILTDDLVREAREIIELMLKRWVQENDFKYLIKHFGINEITTYAFTEYKDLRDKLEDKVFTCKEHKKLTAEIHKMRTKLKTLLLRKESYDDKETLSAKESKRKNEFLKEIDDLSFKEKYDNHRDDHVLFRQLIRSCGTIALTNGQSIITLNPTNEYARNVKIIINKVLDEINQNQPVMPNGSNSKIHIKLIEKNESLFAIPND